MTIPYSPLVSYLPYVFVLLISPILGKYFLRFVYPDVKTYLPTKRYALYILYSLVAYLPAAFISLSGFIVPLYSPYSLRPLFSEYETNFSIFTALFLASIVIESSIVDFVIVRRKRGLVIGIPKHVIKYGIRQQIAERKREKTHKEIERIATNMQDKLKEQDEIQQILNRIKETVARERKERQTEEKKRTMREIERTIGPRVTPPATSSKTELPGRTIPQETPEKTSPPILESKEQHEAVLKERERLLHELEKRLKKAKEIENKKEAEDLLNKLKDKLREEKNLKHEVKHTAQVPEKANIDEITMALRELKRREQEEKEKETKARIGARREEPHGRHHEEDLLKVMVRDVKQQLRETEKAEEKKPEEDKWYKLETEVQEEQPSPSIEISEQDLSPEEGQGLGEDLELGDLEDVDLDLGDMSNLEDIDQSLDSEDFDSMFVNVGDAKNVCPNCGKKGVMVVYCPYCGKPLCSNCAKSVTAEEDVVKYVCPHCGEEFSVKRRIPS